MLRPAHVRSYRPAPPARPAAAIVISSPDRRQHHLRFRIWRSGVGIEVQLDETGVAVGEGYQFAVLGDNDADVDVEMLVAEVRARAEAEISRQYLERASDGHPWMVGVDGEVAGRLLGYDDRDRDGPYKLVATAGRSAGRSWRPPWSPTKGGASAW